MATTTPYHEAAAKVEFQQNVEATESGGSETPPNDRIDEKDMYRMGKKQDLTRVFRQYEMICFTSMIQATWEIVIV